MDGRALLSTIVDAQIRFVSSSFGNRNGFFVVSFVPCSISRALQICLTLRMHGLRTPMRRPCSSGTLQITACMAAGKAYSQSPNSIIRRLQSHSCLRKGRRGSRRRAWPFLSRGNPISQPHCRRGYPSGSSKSATANIGAIPAGSLRAHLPWSGVRGGAGRAVPPGRRRQALQVPTARAQLLLQGPFGGGGPGVGLAQPGSAPGEAISRYSSGLRVRSTPSQLSLRIRLVGPVIRLLSMEWLARAWDFELGHAPLRRVSIS